MMHFHDKDIVIDLVAMRQWITRKLPVKWLWCLMTGMFFVAWYFIALLFGDTKEAIAAAAVGMYLLYRSCMCVAKAEDWKQ